MAREELEAERAARNDPDRDDRNDRDRDDRNDRDRDESVPFVVNIQRATRQNNAPRTVLFTGNRLQPVLIGLRPENQLGLDRLPDLDQYIRIEQGQGLVQIGPDRDDLNISRNVFNGFEIYVPADMWFNLTNTGGGPLKFNIIFTPPQDRDDRDDPDRHHHHHHRDCDRWT